MGRQYIGGLISASIGEPLLSWVDEYAGLRMISRACALRDLLVDAYTVQHQCTRSAAVHDLAARARQLETAR